ncbi:ABC transporter substrate-binding protein [Chloroflexota bacterium]
MKSRRLLLVVISLILVSALAFVSCAEEETKSNVYKVGISTALSGPAAAWGDAQVKCWELAAKDINSQGGIVLDGEKYTIEIIAYDHKFNPVEVATTIDRLILEDKVNVINVLQFTDILSGKAASANIIAIPFEWHPRVVHTDYPYQFGGTTSVEQVTGEFYKWLGQNRPDIKRVARLASADTMGYYVAEAGGNSAVAEGFEIVATEFYDRATTDFTASMLRILATNPDIIDDCAATAAHSAEMAKAARSLGYDGPFIFHAGSTLEYVVGIAGWDKLQGCYANNAYHEPYTGEMKKWKDKVMAEYGSEFNMATILFAGHAYMITSMLESAGSADPAKIVQASHADDFEFYTPTGPGWLWGEDKYGHKNMIGMPYNIIEIQGEEMIDKVWITRDGWKTPEEYQP